MDRSPERDDRNSPRGNQRNRHYDPRTLNDTEPVNNSKYRHQGKHKDYDKRDAKQRYSNIINNDQESDTSSASDRYRNRDSRKFQKYDGKRSVADSYDHQRSGAQNDHRGSTSSIEDRTFRPSNPDNGNGSTTRNGRNIRSNRQDPRDSSLDKYSHRQDFSPRRRHYPIPFEDYDRNDNQRYYRPENNHNGKYSSSGRYDDPWDTPSSELSCRKKSPNDKRAIKRPYPSLRIHDEMNSSVDENSLDTSSERHKGRSRNTIRHSPVGKNHGRKSSSPDNYEDPWDTPGNALHDIIRWSPANLSEKPSDNSSSHKRPKLQHSPSVTKKSALDLKGKNYIVDEKYKPEIEHITVDLEPEIYKSNSRSQPPITHSQSQDKSHSLSQSSKLNGDGPSSDRLKDEKPVYGQDENEERGNWSGKFDFILSMLGYAVGLGNVWRFPYLCYRNGGGAFLFPFLLMMITIGLPIFYLEGALGQFSSCGAMTCWQFAPLFKGLGIAMVAVSGMTSIYYNMIIAWSLHYMFSSFTSDLPFASCQNKWNTENCKLKLPVMTCDENTKADDGLCVDENGKEIGLWNKTLFTEVTGRILQSPSQEYWERFVLNFSNGIQHYGFPKWDLVLCLLLAWVICFLCLIKGIKTTGKVVYFTALFPYVVLVILLFRGVTLANAGLGIKYFITPNFERLADASVWKDAANQVFFSMSIAAGGLITLSSYNRFNNNILRDSIIVAVGDSGTCLLGGFVIFSFLGYMAGQLGVNIEDVAADGAGLAFVVYPEAVSNLPPPTLWAILFFIMLLTLGLDSQFAMVETVLTGMLDQYPHYRPKKTLVILVICIILFILGLPLACPGGMYLLQLMDNYVGGMTLIIIGFFEIIALVFVYGVNRFCKDIHLMTGSTRFFIWKVLWRVMSPLTITFIFIYTFVDYKPSNYDKYIYPIWADIIGWFMTIACVLPIPTVMLFKICKEQEGKNVIQKIRLLCLPTVFWGPALKKHRVLVDYVEGFQVDPFKGLQPHTSFVNYGFDNVGETSIQSDSQASLGVSRISIISTASKGTAATAKSGMSYETNV